MTNDNNVDDDNDAEVWSCSLNDWELVAAVMSVCVTRSQHTTRKTRLKHTFHTS